MKINDPFLASREWRVVRMRALEKHGARCQCCGRTARDGIVINVDHIQPRATHPELALALDNLQVLCNECNHGKGSWSTTDWRTAKAKPWDQDDFVRCLQICVTYPQLILGRCMPPQVENDRNTPSCELIKLCFAWVFKRQMRGRTPDPAVLRRLLWRAFYLRGDYACVLGEIDCYIEQEPIDKEVVETFIADHCMPNPVFPA